MKQSKYVKVEKLSVSPAALVPTAKPEEWKSGEENGWLTVPIGYTVEGFLINDIKTGYPVFIDRRKRNGLEIHGIFETSAVKTVIGNLFLTLNSVYRVSEMEQLRDERT